MRQTLACRFLTRPLEYSRILPQRDTFSLPLSFPWSASQNGRETINLLQSLAVYYLLLFDGFYGSYRPFIIIIINPLQSTAEHRPLQFLAILLDLSLLAPSILTPASRPAQKLIYFSLTNTHTYIDNIQS
jgi:hypothetical protein